MYSIQYIACYYKLHTTYDICNHVPRRPEDKRACRYARAPRDHRSSQSSRVGATKKTAAQISCLQISCLFLFADILFVFVCSMPQASQDRRELAKHRGLPFPAFYFCYDSVSTTHYGCIYIYIYTYIHTYIHTYIYTYVYDHIFVILEVCLLLCYYSDPSARACEEGMPGSVKGEPAGRPWLMTYC